MVNENLTENFPSSTHGIDFFLELPPTVNSQISSPETLLRRSLASVRKRNQIHAHHRSGGQSQPFRRHRIFDENDLRSSTHTVVYDSSKSINHPLRRTVAPVEDKSTNMSSSLAGSGNDSDYDNNQGQHDYANLSKYFPSTRSNSVPVKTFHSNEEFPSLDAHLLGDQNETVLNNNNDDDDEDEDEQTTEARVDLSDDENNDDIDADENTIQSTINNNQQSDNLLISATNSPQSSTNHRTNNRILIKPTATNLDDSAPSNFLAYRKDPLTTRKLLDIRSHLLLNTTLDAT